MSKIALIVTSTRPGRVASKVATWLKPIIEEAAPGASITTVDVVLFNLPVFDEVSIPAAVPSMAQWTTPHAAAWSEEIEKYDGYVLLANEYNFGMSGATKNAIDYLYNAWIGKPILIVSYGIGGGANASDQLKTVLTGMKMRPVETRPQLSFFGGRQGPDMYAALKGELGAETIKAWNADKKAEIVKGVGEVATLLKDAQPAADN